MPIAPSFNAEVISTRMLAPAVRELLLERPDGNVAFQPGQWVNLAVPEPVSGTLLTRAYSIASAPNGTGRFAIAVTRVEHGTGSPILHAIGRGQSLRATGPQGFFTRPADDGRPSFFIATGTGVTPFRSMLYAALEAGAQEPLWLLLGVRHEEDLLYRDEFEALAEQHPNIRIFFTLSQAAETWSERRGYVQTHVPQLWQTLTELSGQKPPHLYVCGLEHMVKAVRDTARKTLGVPREQVHSERYD